MTKVLFKEFKTDQSNTIILKACLKVKEFKTLIIFKVKLTTGHGSRS